MISLCGFHLERQSSLGEVIPGGNPTGMSYLYNNTMGGIQERDPGNRLHLLIQNIPSEIQHTVYRSHIGGGNLLYRPQMIFDENIYIFRFIKRHELGAMERDGCID